MDKEKIQRLKLNLERINHQPVKIEQIGFINSNFTIYKLKYKITYDILLLQCEKENIQVSINLNQVYKSEITNEYIYFFLDNDIEIKIIK